MHQKLIQFLIASIGAFFWAAAPLAFAGVCDNLNVDLKIDQSYAKDQCGTGTCWAHAITASLEQRILVERVQKVPLSEEYLFLRHMLDKFQEYTLSDLRSQRLTGRYDLFNSSVIESVFKRPDQGEGVSLESSLKFGLVPDEVMNSDVIYTSRNWLSNSRRNLIKRLRALEEKYKPTPASADIEAVAKEIVADVTAIETEFQQRIPGKWQTSADGKERFAFQGEWYTPEEFAERYVLRTQKPIANVIVETTLNGDQNRIISFISDNLNKSADIPISLTWTSDQKFSFYHKFFNLKSGCHAVVIIGIVKVNGVVTDIRVKNSWGNEWGTFGNGLIPFAEFMRATPNFVDFQTLP